jgi:nucleoid-associated protein YgaU
MTSTDALVASAASWAAVIVTGYLALGLVAAAVSHRAGALRRGAERMLVLYPPFARAALRAVVVAVLGASAASPAPTALAAAADGGGSPRPPVVAPARLGAEPLDWPVPPHHPRSLPGDHAETVVVRRGDCLWSLAARSLGSHATAAAVAAAWPRWWAANRAVIGTDPDVLHPGERLRVPALTERSAS